MTDDRVLRARLIRLAHMHPEFRQDILPLITTKAAGCEKLPAGPMRENCEKKSEESKEASSTRELRTRCG